MNWIQIANEYPAVYRIIDSDERNLYHFFDSYNVFVLPTCEPEHPQPWGYELHAPEQRFVRQQCRYDSRAAAAEAGFLQACHELNRMISAGNA